MKSLCKVMFAIVVVWVELTPFDVKAVSIKQFSDIVSFGDSLTDSGNTFLVSQLVGMPVVNPSPPYFGGRFSNGPTWADIVYGARFGKRYNTLVGVGPSTEGGPNHAYGGATTGQPSRVPSLLDQVKTFARSVHYKADPEALYVVWAGANDLRNAVNDLDKAPGVVEQAIMNLVFAIKRLEQVGASHILVLNLPDLGRIPEFNQDPVKAAEATKLSEAFNAALDEALKRSVAVRRFDVFGLFEEALSNPARFGLSNVSEACVNRNALLVVEVCTDPDRFLFWDAIHPTGVAHKVLAEEILADLFFWELREHLSE